MKDRGNKNKQKTRYLAMTKYVSDNNGLVGDLTFVHSHIGIADDVRFEDTRVVFIFINGGAHFDIGIYR